MMTPSSFWVKALKNFFAILLGFYPDKYKEEFAEEMLAVFAERANQAARSGFLAIIHLVIEEFIFFPPLLIRVHGFYWQKMRSLKDTTSKPSDAFQTTACLGHPDGRDSWKLAGVEISLFTTLASIMIMQTYLPVPESGEGWLRALGFSGSAILILAAPVFLVGLLRGLPRWALPFAGILLGYSVLMAFVFQLLLYLVIVVLIFFALVFAAYRMNTRTQPLPSSLQNLGSNLWKDWPRLSFGIYGATPLLIILAYDDAVLNSRTPYLAISVLCMLIGALVYIRSRKPVIQMLALLGGMTFSIWPALLDQAFFNGGLWGWMSKPGTWSAASGWMFGLWGCGTVLLCGPILIKGAKSL